MGDRVQQQVLMNLIVNSIDAMKEVNGTRDLAITSRLRSIIESHGGRLWAADNASHGASFHLTLPATIESHD